MLFQASVLFLSGIYIFYTDLKYRKITNLTNGLISLMGLGYSIYFDLLVEHMLAALFLGGIFIILALLTKGFGLGDVKYIFAVSLLLGLQVTLNGLLIGFLLGGVYSVYLLLIKKAKVNDTFAYGPFLVIGQVLSFIISLL